MCRTAHHFFFRTFSFPPSLSSWHNTGPSLRCPDRHPCRKGCASPSLALLPGSDSCCGKIRSLAGRKAVLGALARHTRSRTRSAVSGHCVAWLSSAPGPRVATVPAGVRGSCPLLSLSHTQNHHNVTSFLSTCCVSFILFH